MDPLIEYVRQELWPAIEEGISKGIKPAFGRFGIFRKEGTFKSVGTCCGLGYYVLDKPIPPDAEHSDEPAVVAALQLLNHGITWVDLQSFICGWDAQPECATFDGASDDFIQLGFELRQRALVLWEQRSM